MSAEVVVELSNGDAYVGVPAGKHKKDGDTYLKLENPRKIDVGPAHSIGKDQIYIRVAEIKQKRDLDDTW